MIRWMAFLGLSVVIVSGCIAGTALAKQKDPSKVRNGVLDEIDLAGAPPSKEARVVVRLFGTGSADAGTAKEKKHERREEAVKILKGEGPRMLAEAIVGKLSSEGTFAAVAKSEDPAGDGDIVVEGEFVVINPGSRAKRYWGGFGAGKSGIGVEGRIVNAAGEVLATFKHMLHSGIGIGGGDYVKFLSDDTKDVGTDIATFLSRWATGGDLHDD